MDDALRKMVGGWADKAGAHLDSARESLKCYRTTEAIQAAQVCIELSVKAVFTLLGIEFPRCHGWDDKQLGKIAKQIQDRNLPRRLSEAYLGTINLPRLLIRANFWNQFYLHAKYGIEAENLAPPQELFEQEDAALAVHHAEECQRAIIVLRSLDEQGLEALRG